MTMMQGAVAVKHETMTTLTMLATELDASVANVTQAWTDFVNGAQPVSAYPGVPMEVDRISSVVSVLEQNIRTINSLAELIRSRA